MTLAPAGQARRGNDPLRLRTRVDEEIDLDADYPDLEVGDDLLIPSRRRSAGDRVRGGHRDRARSARFGPTQATVTGVKLTAPTPAIADRRAVELYVLAGDVPLW